jgi:hypothetical protein
VPSSGSASATGISTALTVQALGLLTTSVNVSQGAVTSAGPTHAELLGANAAVNAALGTLGTGALVNAASLTTDATLTEDGAQASSQVLGASVGLPGAGFLAGAPLLAVDSLSTTVSCPAGGTPTATSTGPAQLTVLGQPVTLVNGHAQVSVLAGTGTVTLDLGQKVTTGTTAAASALLLTVDLDVLGLAHTTGTVTLAAAACSAPPAVAPTATGLSPATGTVLGGDTVTVTGAHFVPGATTVSLGGNTVAAGAVTVNTQGTSASFATPAHSAGATTLTLTTAGGTVTVGTFTYAPASTPQVTVTGFSPPSGPTAGGQTVTVTGTGFVPGATTVTLGGTVLPAGAVPVAVGGTSLSFTTPAHAAGSVSLTVTTGAGSTTAGASYAYVAPAPPTLGGLAPTSGPTGGGTQVTLTGTGFVPGGTYVTLGQSVVQPADVAVGNGGTAATFTTPPHLVGPVTVTVTTADGSSGPPGTFTYTLAGPGPAPTVTGLFPVLGSVVGGTTITITGTGFVAGSTTVTVDGVVLPATVTSSTQATFTAPAHVAAALTVTVSTGGGSTSAGTYTYAADPQPGPNAITPPSGPVTGGSTITLTGSGLVPGQTTITLTPITVGQQSAVAPTPVSGPVQRTLRAEAASITPLAAPTQTTGSTTIPAQDVTVSPDGTQATFVAPAHAEGPVDVTATTPSGSSSFGEYAFVAAPTVSGVIPRQGPIAGGTLVTLTGNDLDGAAVTVGGVAATDVTVSASGSSLTFHTPAHHSGTVGIVVANAAGTADAGTFTYLAPVPTVSRVDTQLGGRKAACGTTVQVLGSGFGEGAVVSVDGVELAADQVAVQGDGTLLFRAPCHATGVAGISIRTTGGVVSAGNLTYGVASAALADTGSATSAQLPVSIALLLLGGAFLGLGATRRRA